MNGNQLELDLLAQQFIVHRWHTELGRQVRDKIVKALQQDKPISEVLESHVLEHPANVESYDYPYYPPDAMMARDFWVLADDDLRGIQFFKEDFSNVKQFTRVNLGYSNFSRCKLAGVKFQLTDLSHAQLVNCDLEECEFDKVIMLKTKLAGSSLEGGAFLSCNLRDVDFSGSSLLSVYFENTKMRYIEVDYLTKLDRRFRTKWRDRQVPNEQLADLYRTIRMAYERVELNSLADYYLYKENVANRRYILWPRIRSLRSYFIWLRDFVWATVAGYGAKPFRTLITGFFISFIYSMVYYLSGSPEFSQTNPNDYLSALYFSETTYSTLGYGDITYSNLRPVMRLVSTSEAWLGAVMIALFVVVIAKKLIRRR